MNRIQEVLPNKKIKKTGLAEKLGKSYNMLKSIKFNLAPL